MKKPLDLFVGKKKSKKPRRSYEIILPGSDPLQANRCKNIFTAIRCNQCGHVSWNQNDMKYKYCGHCKTFHV